MRGLKVFFGTLALAFSGVSASAGDAYDPSDDLFAVFGSKCPSYQGEGAATAFGQAGALKSVIESMHADQSCSGIVKALKNIDALTYDRLQTETVERSQLTRLQDQKNEIELALASESAKTTPDVDYVKDLKGALSAKSIELLQAKANPSAAVREVSRGTPEALQRYVTQLFTELEASAGCTTKRPSLVAEIGAQILGIASLFAGPSVGPLLLTGSNAIDRLVTFIKNRQNAKAIRKLASSRLSTAVGCAMESLSATYCESRDILTVVRKSAENCPECALQHWQGVKLLSNELSSFSKWVNEINAGSEASGTAQGREKKAAVQVDADLTKLGIDFKSKINRLKRIHDGGGAQNVDGDLRALVSDLSTQASLAAGAIDFSGPGGGSDDPSLPLAGFFVDDPRCGALSYFYSKGAVKRCPFNPSSHNSCLDCVREFISPNVPSLVEISKVCDNLVAAGSDIVRRQTGLVKQSNPALVLTKANNHLANNITPIQFMRNGLNYLAFLESQDIFKKSGPRATLDDLKKRIIASLCIVDRTDADDCPAEEPPPGGKTATASEMASKSVAKLSEQLIPSGDLFYVSNALYTITQLHVESKMRDGQIDENLAMVLQLSNLDSMDTLLANFLNKDQRESNAETSKAQSIKNLEVVGSLFENQVLDAIRGASTEKMRAQACVRALALPQAPKLGKTDIGGMCRNAVWKSLNSTTDQPIEASYAKLAALPVPERICGMYDAYRRSRLKEQRNQSTLYNRTPSGPSPKNEVKPE